jgi:Tol biopolymer transport system component
VVAAIYTLGVTPDGLADGDPQRLTDGDQPTWSSDGGQIAFIRPNPEQGGTDLFMIDLTSGTVRRLSQVAAELSAPHWGVG